MQRKSQNSKHSGKSTLIIILLLVVIGGGFAALYFWESNQRQREAAAAVDDPYSVGPVTIYYNGNAYQQRSGLDYYLFMGLDKTTDTLSDPKYYVNNQQADFLLLMVVDHSTQTYYGVHINRDTMAEIAKLDKNGAKVETYIAQICLAHAYGSGGKDSCRNELWSVSRYFYDLNIKHYISITMDGIPVLNDLVGGVKVHVSDDFSDVDPSLVLGKDIRLRGKQALSYVRGRKGVADSTNLNRMQRQREFINGFYEQFNASLAKDSKFPFRLASELSDYIISDLTTDELASLANSLKDYRFTSIYTIDGETTLSDENYIEFYTNEDSFRDLVIKLFYKRVYE